MTSIHDNEALSYHRQTAKQESYVKLRSSAMWNSAHRSTMLQFSCVHLPKCLHFQYSQGWLWSCIEGSIQLLPYKRLVSLHVLSDVISNLQLPFLKNIHPL